MSQTEQKSNVTAIIGVLSVFFLCEATFILTPALASLAAKYPDMPYSTITYLSTIPNLIGIPVGVIAGWMIKKGTKYKTLVAGAIIVTIIGGIIPYFITNFVGWLAARCLFGIGFGTCVPMSGTLVQRVFKGEQAGKVQGWGATIQNLSGVILQMLAGVVVAINVDLVWLLHLIFVIPLVLVLLFIPEPEREDTVDGEGKKEKSSLPASVYLESIGFGLMFMCLYPFLLNCAAILSNENIGNSTLAATIASVYTVGGMIAGVSYPFFAKALKKWLMPAMYILTAAGLFVFYFTSSPAVMIVDSVLLGIFVFVLWPAHIVKFGNTVPADDVATASGIFALFMNLCCFLASPFISACGSILGENPRNAVGVGAAGALIVAICFVIATVASKREN